MKYIGLPIIFLFATAAHAQTDKLDDLDLEEIILTFKGHHTDLNLYMFSDSYEDEGNIVEDNYEFSFKNKAEEAKYDLKSDQFIGEFFKISYTVEVATRTDEDGEEEFYEIYTIYSITLQE